MIKLILFAILLHFCSSEAPKGAYTHKLEPQNQYDIRGDDIDKGGLSIPNRPKIEAQNDFSKVDFLKKIVKNTFYSR